jgi:hypothetical protein
MIKMSLDHYDRLLEKCDASSREYKILKNSLIVLAIARRFYPDAISAIEKAIARLA